MPYSLLAEDEPAPVLSLRGDSCSPFVITVDHASKRIPRRLGALGLPPSELERHIAWDIGALAVGTQVAEKLDAALVAQNYSRLVIDCNRDVRHPSSIPLVGESTAIPGNFSLSQEQITARQREFFEPYHTHIRALLDERLRAGRRTILVTQHSMTEVFKGEQRLMHAAVLYNRDRRFATLVLKNLRRETGLIVAENEPYAASDEVDYTIPHHAEARGLPYVELEIRQDLIAHDSGQTAWANRIADALQRAAHVFLER